MTHVPVPEDDRQRLSRRRLFGTSAFAALTLTGVGALTGVASASRTGAIPAPTTASPAATPNAPIAPSTRSITDGVVTGLTRHSDRLVAVGQHMGGSPAVWTRASDGPWRRVTVDLGTARLRALTAHEGGLVAAGSLDGAPTIWTSGDGLRWRARSVTAPSGTLSAVAASADGFVAVGERHDGETAEGAGALVVQSTDGVSWRAVDPVGLPSGSETGLLAIVHDGSAWLVASHTVDGTKLWRSVDARRWNSTAAQSFAGAVIASMKAEHGELLAVGSTIAGTRPQVWRHGHGRWVDITGELQQSGNDGLGAGALNDIAVLEPGGSALVVGTQHGRPLTALAKG